MNEENIVLPDTTNEPVQETVQETVETPVVEITEEAAQAEPEVSLEQLQATNKKLFERAKKAEAELKALKTKVPTPVKPVSQPASPSDVEETVLLANGMSEELLGELKAVAKARGISSLIKAQADSIFVAVKEKFEKEQKSRDASLGASKGSGAAKVRKTFATPGLSREEHMKMVKEAL
jgi:hypothetical protein